MTAIVVNIDEKKKRDYTKYFLNYYYKNHADMMEYKHKTNKLYYEKYKKRYHCTKCNVSIAPSNLRKHLTTQKHNLLKSNEKDNILDTQKDVFVY